MSMKRVWVKWICAVLCAVSLTVTVLAGVLAGVWYFEGKAMQIQTIQSQMQADTGRVSNAVYKWVADGQIGTMPVPVGLSTDQSNFRYVIYERNKAEEKILGGNVGSFDALYWETEYTFTRQMPMSTANRDWIVFIQYGVAQPLTADDEYAAVAREDYLVTGVPRLMTVAIACLAVGVILLILLMVYAGRRQGREDIVLTWHERIPYDLYLVVQFFAHVGIWFVLVDNERTIEQCLFLPSQWGTTESIFFFVVVTVCILVEVILALALILTTVVRLKARTLLRNTIIARVLCWLWRILKVCGRGINKVFHALPMVWRAVLAFGGYLLVTVLTVVVWFFQWYWNPAPMVICQLIWQGLVLVLICRWVFQWKTIRTAVGEITSGRTDTQIDTTKFYPDLKEHALQLNDLGHAIDAAVEERMKSERFKSELITNVSHDLKTPLTSIINYVDLLKKEEIDNATAVEYIDVLDRKSQRLKKLTEDLVEASKASTGALPVEKERLDLVQLVRQAMGEYEEKLSGVDLTPVLTLPEGELHVTADGRHLWRVLDNLLNNCVKYAMEGTRVYVDARTQEEAAVITVKSISRQELNVSAEQLMERFVRGDESRTTEGSGLGLSIARSLVELQGGRFKLEIDGDLFKVRVILPFDTKFAPLPPQETPREETIRDDWKIKLREKGLQLLTKVRRQTK